MFKMAKKILAIDAKDSAGGGGGGSGSSSSSKRHNKQDKAAQLAEQAAGGGGGGPARNDGLDDFNKLESDPRIPLNVRQIFKITKSWKAINRTMIKTGTAMFLK